MVAIAVTGRDAAMHELYNLFRPAHIAAGGVALFMAPGAMLIVKGGLWQRGTRPAR